MDNKSDVRAIMARFQANGSSSEDVPSTGPGRIKQPVHATLSGQPLHMKKPLSDSGATIPPKSSFLKNTPSKSDIVVQEVNKTKALASIFTNPQEDTSPPFTKHKLPSKSSFIQMPEPIAPPTKPSMIVSRTEPKPAFPKPAVISTKPNWIKEDSTSSPPPPAPKIPAVPLKPNSNFVKLQQQREANVQHTKAEVITDPVIKPTLPIIPVAKPTSNMRTAQTLFNKEPAEQETCMKPSAVNKLPLSNSIPPPKPLTSKKPSLKKPSPHINNSDPSGPKKNPLPNSLALGPAPAKPNRPPHVKLDVFEGGLKTPADDPKRTISPPPPSHPSNHSNHVTPPPPRLPSLHPRHTEAVNPAEDDVDGLTSAPPPLPPDEDDDEEDEEMYEDLDERWEATEQKQEKKKVKDIKEERKRLEAERKEQKEREKKEQEAKKKFKLVGPVEVLQKGKARADFKGNKTDLSLKQGDSLDIIRIHGNPEGKWLGRSLDGSIGYVKITSVEIDFNSLKQQGAGQAHEPELYDDIDSITHALLSAVVFPPLPVDGEEIYDDVDPIVDISSSEALQSPMKPRVFQWMLERSRRAPSTKVLPPPSQFSGDTDQKGGAIDEEIYDDVDSQNIPPPSPMIGIPKVDPKRQKRLEKEEKEFRKKFKYEGEITVLDQVTIIPNLTNKKWSSKELPLKAGEKLDVIVKAIDNKLICRNEDGKFGFVSTSYIVTDDGDIYDDIGDDCIYDND
ncbi:hypothetical protein NQD34_009016 [Periophthalmus magnuspinnatus]|nr:hypothetical protein NQD34_009016 [Periophthalmus magnuspinnatus]